MPLLDVVKVSKDNAPAKINRSNRRRQVTLLANLAPGYSQSAIIEGVQREIKALNMPAGYVAAPIGQSKEMGKTAQAFIIAFALSMLFMYLVLAAQFESWLHPVTILIALPLTLPFALVSLILLGQSLDIYSCWASWCCSAWSRRTRFSRSTTPISSARRAWSGWRRSCRPTATGCGRS